jgi:hypothetical protein
LTQPRAGIVKPSRDPVLSVEDLGPQIALAVGLTVAAALVRLLLGVADKEVFPSAVNSRPSSPPPCWAGGAPEA